MLSTILRRSVCVSGQPFVALTVKDSIALLTLNRPPVNALSRALIDEAREAAGRAMEDARARVLVIASALPKSFSAGADIQELAALDAAGSAAFAERGQGLYDLLESAPKPVIAAVRGVAFGGGCELALACDLRVAGTGAGFALPEVSLGIMPGWGGTQRLPRLTGKTAALEMMMTGKPVPASRALELGLVNRVVPDDEVLDEALRLAAVLASKPPRSLALIKQAVREGAPLPLPDALALERELFVEAMATADAREGIEAFLQKRPPRFHGR